MSLSDDPSSVIPRRVSIKQIAAIAGVGTATVDRVLNDRDHVKDTTRQRVLQAKAALESGYSPRRQQPWRLKALLPSDAGPSTEYLAAALQRFCQYGNATIECEFVRKLEPALLARKLIACTGQGIDAVLFQALEHPRVAAAVETLSDHRIPALAMLSGISGTDTICTVGIDNRAAGRTAGYLMGRLTRQTGSVAVVIGANLYRGHEDREVGFRAAVREGFRHINRVITVVGRDEKDDTHQLMLDVLSTQPELIGVYNVGAANHSIARALRETGTAEEIVFIGHHLTKNTKAALGDGTMDVVLHMNLNTIARQAIDTILAHLEDRPAHPDTLPIEIVTRENLLGFQLNELFDDTGTSSQGHNT